jgi:hypothetical protein
MVDADSIAAVGIDAEGRLFVRPASARFPQIYREAMEVHWDAASRQLYSPRPHEWTYPRWFQQIVHAAAEQGWELRLMPSTAWIDIPAEVRAEIVRWSASRVTQLSS